MSKILNKEKGITIVSLIITIIVLVIISAVTIIVVFDLDIINLSTKATENYAGSQIEEEGIMSSVAEVMEDAIKNIQAVQGGDKTNPDEPTHTPEIELPVGWKSEKVYAVKSKDEKIVPVPLDCTLSNIEGEDSVKDGLVIYDIPEEEKDGIDWEKDENGNGWPDVQEKYSQFVWVPVDNPSDMFSEDESGNLVGKIWDFGTASSPKNPPAEIKYTTKGPREPDLIAWDSTLSYFQTAGIEGISTKEDFLKQLRTELQQLKDSIEIYHGFYIGRYETGDLSKEKIAVTRGNEDIADQMWYVEYQKAKEMATGKKYTSSMIWGCQWDATLKWFLDDPETRGFVTNSTGKGNYAGAQGGLNEKIPTGSNDNYKIKNIYDMGGNMFEQTIEAKDANKRTLRRRIL